MRSIVSAALLCGVLCGCASTHAPLVTQNQIDALRAAYDAAFLAPAAAYRRLPICAAGERPRVGKPCAQASVIRKLQAADRRVAVAFDAAQSVLDSSDPSHLNAKLQSLAAAIVAAEGLSATLGVK